jgi:hypothetical protein
MLSDTPTPSIEVIRIPSPAEKPPFSCRPGKIRVTTSAESPANRLYGTSYTLKSRSALVVKCQLRWDAFFPSMIMANSIA